MDPRNIHHRYAPNAAVKYDVQSSPLDSASDPRWIAGSNILTSIKGACERRPGFPAGIETNTTTFTGSIQRIYGWRKWGGPYFVLVNRITETSSDIYFIVVGNPSYSNFTLLYSDTASTKPFDFSSYNNLLYFGNGSVNRKWNGDVIKLTYKWGVDGPAAPPPIAITGTTSGVTATQGYYYVYCYGTLFEHVSSPSEASASTGVFAATSGADITVQYSTDPQVNQIFVFRSTDGGGAGGPFFQLPIAINNNTAGGTVNLFDIWPDDLLLSTVAPPFFANDPPPAMRGIVTYASRLVGFNESSVFFSNNEEQTTGVAEESFAPSNKYSFGLETTCLQEVNEGLLVHCGGSRIHKITGDSLDTFRQDKMVDRMGTRINVAAATVGKSALWLDSANLLRISDGYQQQEFGLDIRPDIQSIIQDQAQMAVHLDGRYQWVMVLDGGASKIRVYDLDRNAWMIPWDVGGTAIASVELAPGVFKVLLAHTSGQILAMDYETYNDNGTLFAASQTISLTNLTSDNVPGQIGLTEYVVLETDGAVPTQVSALVDEDPDIGTYVDITANKQVPPLHKTVTAGVVESWYYYRDIPGRRMSFKIVWPTENTNFKLYGFDVAGSTMQKGSG